MNKLLGFYELRDSLLPTIPWKEYNDQTEFDPKLLWTVRTAVYRGEDLNLPRSVGVTADEASSFALKTARVLGDRGIVIYYPYFLAEKSGTLNVYNNKVIIEAVKEDLWNLVTFSDREVTIINCEDETEYIGNKDFVTEKELSELYSYVKKIKAMFRDDLLEAKSVLLEWSYAYKCDIDRNKVGERYLVFYEARTV